MSSKHCQQNDMPKLVGEQIANSHTENKNANNSKGFSRRKFLQLSAIGLIGVGISGWYWPNRWRYIVIHHSAGNYGNIKFLQKIHRERQAGDPVDAIPYHFIVGNGNGMAMGEIASDWRQENHLWGAHVSARNRDRNYRGLGICMIGNFEINPVPEPQFQSLVSLCQQLVTRYDIPKTHISGHGLTPGEQTLCPGKHFPMSRLLDSLS